MRLAAVLPYFAKRMRETIGESRPLLLNVAREPRGALGCCVRVCAQSLHTLSPGACDLSRSPRFRAETLSPHALARIRLEE